jgi:MazG C-terminal domain
VDEAQDGGRAIVVEEGLTAWIFSRAKQLNFFQGQTTISFDVLKTVQQFVAGYEVEACPLSLWEIAILKGYEVFRQVKKNYGGIIVCDRSARTIRYDAANGEVRMQPRQFVSALSALALENVSIRMLSAARFTTCRTLPAAAPKLFCACWRRQRKPRSMHFGLAEISAIEVAVVPAWR